MLNLVLFLKTTPLFGAIPLEDIARIAGLAEPVFVAAGERIVDAEDPVRHVFVVRSGTVEVRIDDRTIETIAAGASIGETAVFGEERHATAMRAASAVSMMRFRSASSPISSPSTRKRSRRSPSTWPVA